MLPRAMMFFSAVVAVSFLERDLFCALFFTAVEPRYGVHLQRSMLTLYVRSSQLSRSLKHWNPLVLDGISIFTHKTQSQNHASQLSLDTFPLNRKKRLRTVRVYSFLHPLVLLL